MVLSIGNNMKFIYRILISLFVFAIVSSCSNDITGPDIKNQNPSFSLKDGTIWYYDIMRIEDNVTTITSNQELHFLEPSVIDGRECLKQYQLKEGESLDNAFFEYVRADEKGFYGYYVEFLEDYTHYFPELNNSWIQLISFDKDKLTVFDLKTETTDKLGNPIKVEMLYELENLKDTTVKYKGELVHATIARRNILVKISSTKNGEDTERIDDRGAELIFIPNIGIFKLQGLRDGEYRNSFMLLTDHK